MHSQMVATYARLSRTSDATRTFYTEATTRKPIARLSLATDDRLLEVGFGDAASRIETCETNGQWGRMTRRVPMRPLRLQRASQRCVPRPWQ